jgi:hypothetical protein
VQRTPSLASISKNGMIIDSLDVFRLFYLLEHERIKENSKRSFQEALLSRNPACKRNNNNNNNTANNQKSSNEYSDERLWFFKSEKHYGWVMRVDLGIFL